MTVSLDALEAFFPDLVQFDRGDHVPQAVFGDVSVAAFGQQGTDIHAADAHGLGGRDPEGLAVEIEVELAGGSLAAADIVEGELFGQIAVGLRLVAVTQPVFARDGHVEQR